MSVTGRTNRMLGVVVMLLGIAVLVGRANDQKVDVKDYPVEITVVSYAQGTVVGDTTVYQNPNCVTPQGNMVAYCQVAHGDIHTNTSSEKIVTLKVRSADDIYTAEGKDVLLPGKYNARMVGKTGKQEILIVSTNKKGKLQVVRFKIVGMERLPN